MGRVKKKNRPNCISRVFKRGRYKWPSKSLKYYYRLLILSFLHRPRRRFIIAILYTSPSFTEYVFLKTVHTRTHTHIAKCFPVHSIYVLNIISDNNKWTFSSRRFFVTNGVDFIEYDKKKSLEFVVKIKVRTTGERCDIIKYRLTY